MPSHRPAIFGIVARPLIEQAYVPTIQIDGLLDYKIADGIVWSSYYRLSNFRKRPVLKLVCRYDTQIEMRHEVAERAALYEAARWSH